MTNCARIMLFGDMLGRRAQMVEQGIADAQASALNPPSGAYEL